MTKPRLNISAGRAADAFAHRPEIAEGEPSYDTLYQLRADVGEDFFSQILGICARDAETQMLKLETAIQQRDFAAVRSIAHSLKGLFAQFGALQTSRCAAACESADAGSIDLDMTHLRRSAALALARFEAARSGRILH